MRGGGGSGLMFAIWWRPIVPRPGPGRGRPGSTCYNRPVSYNGALFLRALFPMHTTLRRCAVLLALALTLAASLIAQQSSPYDPALWSGLRYRMIGPYRGGRVTTVTGVPSQPATFYMGSTGGGVW